MYWMMETLTKIYEGGLMIKWDDWMFYGEINQNRKIVLEP